jgi:hypothetical protein
LPRDRAHHQMVCVQTISCCPERLNDLNFRAAASYLQPYSTIASRAGSKSSRLITDIKTPTLEQWKGMGPETKTESASPSRLCLCNVHTARYSTVTILIYSTSLYSSQRVGGVRSKAALSWYSRDTKIGCHCFTCSPPNGPSKALPVARM